MTNGKYRTDYYNVVHGCAVSPNDDLGLGNIKAWLIQQAAPLVPAFWDPAKFQDQGYDVIETKVSDIRVGLAPANNDIHYEHYVIQYRLKVVSDPVPVAIISAIALGLVILFIAIGYVLVSQASTVAPSLGAGIAIAIAAVGIGAAWSLSGGFKR